MGEGRKRGRMSLISGLSERVLEDEGRNKGTTTDVV